jgi:branched-chain amino acid transport system substrate-binding protein
VARNRELILGVLLLLLTACTFPGAIRPTVKIGLVAPFEGRYRYVGYDVIYAVRLALQEANDHGGVGGYGIELVAYDDGALPAMAVQQARKLDVDPDVVAALGHFRQRTTVAARDAYVESGIPLVAPTALDPELSATDSAVHPLIPAADSLAEALLDRASALDDGGEIVVLGDEGSLAPALRRRAVERGQSLDEASTEADGWLAEVLVSQPPVILLALEPVRAGEVVATLRETGWGGDALGGPALAASDFAAVAGTAAEGTTFVTPWPFPPHAPMGESFIRTYRVTSGGVEPGPYALPAYEATWIVLDALERAAEEGPLSREKVSTALTESRGDGHLGQLSFDRSEERRWALYWYRIGPDGTPELESTM